MIDLYTWATPNGWKASIMLEETKLPYELHSIDFGKRVQKQPWYLKISPGGKIPAIVDRDESDVAIFESGAVLIYLANKAGQFLPSETRARSEVLQWLFFQVGQVGPLIGQTVAFLHYIQGADVAHKRFHKLVMEVCGVLNQRLMDREYLAGEYSIADMATFPWLVGHSWAGIELDEFPHLQRWIKTIESRDAVQRGLAIPNKLDIHDKRVQARLLAQSKKIV